MRLNVLASFLGRMREDFGQPPPVGLERLGLCFARFASSYNMTSIVITEYLAFPPHSYVNARHAPVAFDTRWMMAQAEAAARQNAGIFLTHLHEHLGKPWFSHIDMRTNREIIRPFALIDQSLPTGALVLSFDNTAALLARSDGLLRLDVFEVPG